MVAQKKLATNYTNCTNWFWSLLTFVVIVGASSCSSSGPTDVRTVVPGDALVYLETQDLGKALQAVTDNDAFRAAANSQPDFSALNGIKVGVAVTGFETKEERVSDENSVLNFQPRFVAVAETNAWNYQAIKFAENKLGEFVNDIYGGGVELERFPRFDGDYFVWTADDGRKAYGLVIGSVIFFGNDETAIEKCVAVRKGETESIAKNPKLRDEEFIADPADYLARGFVSEQGLAQLSNIAGVQIAMGSSEESDVRAFVARVLPEVARSTTKSVTWTTAKSVDLGVIYDHFQIDLDPVMAKILQEKMVPSSPGRTDDDRIQFIPADVPSVTSYTIGDTRSAWEAILTSSQRNTDALSAGLIAAFSDSLFDAYAIEDPVLFLGSVKTGILTARFDAEGEDVIVVAEAEDLGAVKRSIAKRISFAKPPQLVGDVRLWRSEDGDVAFANVGDIVLAGDAESVSKAIEARSSGQNYAKLQMQPPLFSKASDVTLTVSKSSDPDARLVQVLGQRAEGGPSLATDRKVSTFMYEGKLRRVERSNFGLIGSIIEQFAKEQ